MNTNGNIYTVIYTTVVVVVVAAVLAFVSETLKPKQEANVKADAISQMLTASKFYEKSELDAMSNEQKIDAYKAVAKSSVLVNAEGQECGTLDLSKQEIYTTGQLKAQDNLIKKGSADFKLPVFVFEKDGQNVTVIPCYGAGLWGPIWGYIALNEDLQTIRGAYFDHASETPGLGAKIKDDPFGMFSCPLQNSLQPLPPRQCSSCCRLLCEDSSIGHQNSVPCGPECQTGRK